MSLFQRTGIYDNTASTRQHLKCFKSLESYAMILAGETPC